MGLGEPLASWIREILMTRLGKYAARIFRTEGPAKPSTGRPADVYRVCPVRNDPGAYERFFGGDLTGTQGGSRASQASRVMSAMVDTIWRKRKI
jgi:hypothetical protein